MLASPFANLRAPGGQPCFMMLFWQVPSRHGALSVDRPRGTAPHLPPRPPSALMPPTLPWLAFPAPFPPD